MGIWGPHSNENEDIFGGVTVGGLVPDCFGVQFGTWLLCAVWYWLLWCAVWYLTTKAYSIASKKTLIFIPI